MTDQYEFKTKLFKAIKSDRTIMLGLHGVDKGHVRPMTAQIENDQGPLWFFTSTESDLVNALEGRERAQAIATFASKGHDLFASIDGTLSIDKNPAVIERLWSPFVAAWFKGGKTDPKLTLLRLDATNAEVWIDASSLIAGVKLLLGIDPKEEYKDKVANVNLDTN